MADVYVNQERFSSKDVDVAFLGRTPQVTEINFEDSNSTEELHVLGNRESVGFTRGDVENTGDITMPKEEWLALQRSAPNGDVKRIPNFDIVVALSRNGLIYETVTLRGCIIKNNPFSAGGAGAMTGKANLRIGQIVRK